MLGDSLRAIARRRSAVVAELVTIAATIISFGNRGSVVRQSAYFECLECANYSGGFGFADQISVKGSSCWSYHITCHPPLQNA